jgi:hypothetical protein
MISAVQAQALVLPALSRDTLRASWVTKYRSQVATADRWAGAPTHPVHSLETQERVFRMAQQMVELGIDPQELFANLAEADRSVASATSPDAVAMAGSRAIGPLLPLDDRSIVVRGDGNGPDLSAFGFQPVAFDGHDPAAYAWARFELTMRAQEERDQLPCSCHPWSSPSTIGLARL